jgi:hypothetical protein
MDVNFPTGTTYILVIDTDQYSGNFEREMAGYTTGICDYDRAHGKDEADDAKTANPDVTASLALKSKAVQHEEYGMVTNTIRATPRRANNGMGYHYDIDSGHEEEARAKAVESMRAYMAGQIEKCERRLANEDFEPERPGAWTKEACERTLKSAQQSIANAGKYMPCPAYESVAMFFDAPLTDAELAFVTERANEYAAKPFGGKPWGQKPFNVLGVYMVKHTVTDTEEPV